MPSPKNNGIRLRAFAKINLSLKITGKIPDGYHSINSVMQSVSLHDEIDIAKSDNGIKIICSVPGIQKNTAQKAAELLFAEVKKTPCIRMNITKNIPLSSGMGGGSADAAATLIGINKLLGLNLHVEKLAEIGARIGADVPFCLSGGTARCAGIGEAITRENPRSGAGFILVIPRFAVSTKLVYDEYDRIGSGTSGNDLENAAVSLFPEIKNIKDSLSRATGRTWQMSGSGPTLFLELRDLSEAERYADALSGINAISHVVKRMNAGVEII